MCGFQFFELHHKTYERLGRERDDDLEVLCKPCHERADEQRCAKALYDARLNGWATKVYGDDWEWNEDKSEVEQDFDDWLQGHDDEY